MKTQKDIATINAFRIDFMERILGLKSKETIEVDDENKQLIIELYKRQSYDKGIKDYYNSKFAKTNNQALIVKLNEWFNKPAEEKADELIKRLEQADIDAMIELCDLIYVHSTSIGEFFTMFDWWCEADSENEVNYEENKKTLDYIKAKYDDVSHV